MVKTVSRSEMVAIEATVEITVIAKITPQPKPKAAVKPGRSGSAQVDFAVI
jgi:hypothetical protein